MTLWQKKKYKQINRFIKVPKIFTKVILRRAEVDSQTHGKSQLVILSMDKCTIKVGR